MVWVTWSGSQQFERFHCLTYSRISVFEVPESDILDVVNEIFVSRVNMQLLQHFNQHEAEYELNSQVSFLRQPFQFRTNAHQIAAVRETHIYVFKTATKHPQNGARFLVRGLVKRPGRARPNRLSNSTLEFHQTTYQKPYAIVKNVHY